MAQGQKQALVAAADPLNDAGILRQVFTFLPGSWLFLGAVCIEWATIYASTAAKQVRSFTLHGISRLVTCGAKTTLYSAAIVSPAAARLACECGLANMLSHNSRLQVAAGLHADIQTLTALRELGMPLSASRSRVTSVSLCCIDVHATMLLRQTIRTEIARHMSRRCDTHTKPSRSGSSSSSSSCSSTNYGDLKYSTCTMHHSYSTGHRRVAAL
jgi:hypothetical protein